MKWRETFLSRIAFQFGFSLAGRALKEFTSIFRPFHDKKRITTERTCLIYGSIPEGKRALRIAAASIKNLSPFS